MGIRYAEINKTLVSGAPASNLEDYEATRASFSWETARRELSGLPAGRGLNIAHEAVDRHAQRGAGEREALRCIGKDGSVRSLTYGQART